MIAVEAFGRTARGEKVEQYTMRNASGMCVQVLDYGCTIRSILVPDAEGKPVDVALGYDDLRGYEDGNCFFGAFVGRYANRIRGAAFSLNGKRYTLEKNDGNNHLHGVYCRRVFSAETDGNALVFRLRSPDGEEGFPGTLDIQVRYTLQENNALRLDYTARTDADTVLNLTNHSYFNLNGAGDVLKHRLRLDADSFTECDAEILPTGRILPVAGTALDFRAEREIGTGMRAGDPHLKLCGGYDHNYVLNGKAGELRRFAEASGDLSGIRLEAFTTQPGVQFYSGNFIHHDSAHCGKDGVRYPQYGGFCLETQHFPCSPNIPAFPSAALRPGEIFQQTTVYRFLNC